MPTLAWGRVVAPAVMRTPKQSVVLKRQLSPRAKLSVYQSIYVSTLTYGHELRVVTEKMRVKGWSAQP